MKKIKDFFSNWRRSYKIAASNPENFNEYWSLNTSKIQVVSFIGLLVLVLSFLIGFLMVKSPLGEMFGSDKSSIDRNEIVEQKLKIDSLARKLDAQEKYIDNIKMIILGEVPKDTVVKLKNKELIDPNKVKTEASPEEKIIADKVKNDQRTVSKKEASIAVHFISPVTGVISQKFDPKHLGVDIITPKNKTVLACLSGTVVYSGFSQKDGHILILEHPNNFISVYKHNQSRLKISGDKVRTGDPIAIVGNSGENSTGPHLHFELWLNQKAVNPLDYMKF